MKHLFLLACCCWALSCGKNTVAVKDNNLHRFANTVNISKTPINGRNPGGLFTDKGSWMGFTIPERENPVAGFCGPFDIDAQRWISQSLVAIAPTSGEATVTLDTSVYYPGSVWIKGQSGTIRFSQELYFINKNTALLKIETDTPSGWYLHGSRYDKKATSQVIGNRFLIETAKGEIVSADFTESFSVTATSDSTYRADYRYNNNINYVLISYWHSRTEYEQQIDKTTEIRTNPEEEIEKVNKRWSDYITKTLREDMPEEYNRIAVKAVITLISNWRAPKGDLFHEGIIPSHAVTYFNGFWAWDSWKHAAAIAYIEPELAKNQIRTMLDYQQEDGMVIDCIFTDRKENNARDSKSSILAWAVNKIFKETNDTAFVREMMPKMKKYYQWWYQKRDINKNGLCEFGSSDGTLVAAKWESGMDNAVRFDKSKMLKIADDAYVFDQESVDLNTFLVFERQQLQELASIIGDTITFPDFSDKVRNYFFDSKKGYFYDRTLDGKFIATEACEGWLPLWTKLATKEQAEAVKKMIQRPDKFSTYIPFPTCAANDEGFNPEGYWRGAVWLDQAYFGISGLRNYGYKTEADTYTDQLFTRCEGLLGDGPITENYNPLQGTRAQARHFSWSAAHLLMLYKEYGK